MGLEQGPETLERSSLDGGLDLDLVTHDAAKFFRLLLKKNGYVLEQLLSPLVVFSSPAHEELVARKVAGREEETLRDDDVGFYGTEVARLTAVLDEAAAESPLPERPTASAALHDLLVRLRLGGRRRS